MIVPHTYIKDYLFRKFEDYKEAHEELIVHSIFIPDEKYHMSINKETGLWRCFKTGEAGNFIKLVATLENIPYTLAIHQIARKLLDTPEALFLKTDYQFKNKPLTVAEKSVEEDFKTFKRITSKMSQSASILERQAFTFVKSRGLLKFPFFLATSGKYKGRVIIPYVEEGIPFFFQARNLGTYGMKYLNPSSKEYGVKSSDIVFPFDKSCNYVIVTEGPLDAITLRCNGFNATSIQGSMMSHEQLKQLKGRKIILSFDNDEPGAEGMLKADKLRKIKNLDSFYSVAPPPKYKDWNDYHLSVDGKTFKDYVVSSVSKINYLSKAIEGLA